MPERLTEAAVKALKYEGKPAIVRDAKVTRSSLGGSDPASVRFRTGCAAPRSRQPPLGRSGCNPRHTFGVPSGTKE